MWSNNISTLFFCCCWFPDLRTWCLAEGIFTLCEISRHDTWKWDESQGQWTNNVMCQCLWIYGLRDIINTIDKSTPTRMNLHKIFLLIYFRLNDYQDFFYVGNDLVVTNFLHESAVKYSRKILLCNNQLNFYKFLY